jgi:hypothetical protein
MREPGRLFRPVRRVAAVAATVCALSCSGAVPVMAAASSASRGSVGTVCGTAAGSAPLDQIGAPACSRGTTAAQERYEAILAGAGVLLFSGGALVYRRKRHP